MSFPPDPPILQVRNLCKHYEARRGFGSGRSRIKAVDDVSFDLHRGETLGLVGESGCGKSSVARTILRLEEPTSGEVLFRGRDVAKMSAAEFKEFRRKVQVVFQDPYAALNPRMTVEQIVSEPWMVHRGLVPRAEWGDRVRDLLTGVGLRREHAERHPHQFSGGQLQRIGIARAMALDPEVLICDEPVSALDLSVQAQVINLLEDIQARSGIAYLFIAHDLSVVRHLSDRVAVMYLGRMAEIGAGETVFETPAHPYSAALLSAEPVLDVTAPPKPRIPLMGEIPSPANPPSGCRFRNRCWLAQPLCAAEVPLLTPQPPGSDRLAACHFPLEVGPEATLRTAAAR
jgi:oligopeptide transport system ATP-binding protein